MRHLLIFLVILGFSYSATLIDKAGILYGEGTLDEASSVEDYIITNMDTYRGKEEQFIKDLAEYGKQHKNDITYSCSIIGSRIAFMIVLDNIEKGRYDFTDDSYQFTSIYLNRYQGWSRDVCDTGKPRMSLEEFTKSFYKEK